MGEKRVLSSYEKSKICEEWQSGQKTKEITMAFKVSQQTVQCIVCEGLKNRKKIGRPPSLSKYTVKKILHQTQQNPTKSASSIAKGIGVKASNRTVQRILWKNQFTKKCMKGRQSLSVKAMADQVEFVCKHLENPSPI